MPKRIQRKRTKGWRMPKGAVYVGRPSEFANPYTLESGKYSLDDTLNRRCVVTLFRILSGSSAYRARAKEQLRDKDLACWCPLDMPCHADVLLEIANS